MYHQRNLRNAKYEGELALGERRNISGRVICDESAAERTISPPGVRPQAGRPNNPAPEKSAGDWFEV